MPALRRHLHGALVRASPAFDFLALVVQAHQGPGTGAVVIPLGLPAGDESIHGGHGGHKKQLDVLVQVILVADGDHLCKLQPVAGLSGRAGPVAHKFDDGLSLGGQVGIEVNDFMHFFFQLL